MIEIKGKRVPVIFLKIVKKEPLSELIREIKDALSNNLLRGSLVVLENPEILNEKERREIEKVIRDLSLNFFERNGDYEKGKSSKLLIVNRNLRAGQVIEHEGDILILGDVNRDAEIIAGGNIIVMGKLRGIAKAGLIGDEDAVVVALRMEPQLIQIGKVKAILEDSERISPGYPEVAKVEGKEIILEEIEGAEKWLKYM